MIKQKSRFDNIRFGLLDDSSNAIKIKFVYFKKNPNKKDLMDVLCFAFHKLGYRFTDQDIIFLKDNMNGKFRGEL